jgi:hypothetical protein
MHPDLLAHVDKSVQEYRARRAVPVAASSGARQAPNGNASSIEPQETGARRLRALD